MKEINILPPQVFNLLAAGEVVENPASIVKEAVENSLDAGASSVEINITNGGTEEITVTDNGRGVAAEQIDKVFMPHATSKIARAKDIETIATLGFRGEALGSIASVSHVTFTSRTNDEPAATRLELRGGEIIGDKKTSANTGTQLTVRSLFYNTPARKKFLRSHAAETNSVTSTVQKLILSNPSVSFKYTIDANTVYNYKGASLLDAVKLIYGSDIAEKILPVNKTAPNMQLEGFVSIPSFKKHNRTWQTVMINSRTVEGGLVAAAAAEAYSNYLIPGSFPFFVLNLKVDLTAVDVNVHPRKAEVRFSNGTEVTEFVKNAVETCVDTFLSKEFSGQNTALPASSPVKGDKETVKSKPVLTDEKPHYDDEFDKETLRAVKFISSSKSNSSLNPASKYSETAVASAPRVLSFLEKMETRDKQIAEEKSKLNLLKSGKTSPIQTESPQVREGGFDARIIGTVFDCFILITHQDSLFILDQHAAHERLLYDELQQQIDNGEVITQHLLEPSLIYLTPEEMTHMTNAAPSLNQMGITAEQFGNNCFRITAVPVKVLPFGIDTVIANVLREVKAAPPKRLSELIRERVITECCRNAIKAGARLSPEQTRAFLRQFTETQITPVCPHGRPIFVKLTQTEIEKMFRRR